MDQSQNISRGEQKSTKDHDNDSCVVTTDYPAYQYEFDMPCYIARLPVELLCEIFAHCLPFGRHGDQYPIPRIEDAPMLLCHVCSHWRQVALSFTALWSSFSGRCSYSYRNRNPERNVRVATQALVKLWLERSHPHPISTEFDSSMLPAVRQLLFVNAYRWDSLSIMLDDEIIGELMAIPQAGAPLVENLSLIVYECEKTHLEIPSLLPRFPNLRRLYYHNSRTLNRFFLNIPWSQMTHITLCCEFPADQFLKSLGQCMAAEYIDVQWIIPSAPIQPAQVILPRLAYLRIDSCAGDITLLDAFTVPSLRTLKFNTQSDLAHRNFKALDALVSRSSCTLETFHMEDLALLEEDLIGYLTLPCLQSVHELEISSRNIFDQTLSLPAYPSMTSGVGGIFPHLERLHLRYMTTTDGLLSNAIASRWRKSEDPNAPASLKGVKLLFARDKVLPHNLDTLHITKFEEQGLSVSWSWY
ncbi:hypothetical protein Hypma_010700 [Hypsizygus marmoreus]|uniref:Uncharacterized protein n=1 Tax=Hypsizygus marmoreus TaxID=39966 RepID=A0A369JK42_HYPMA|nr:hypothetical protein Hypma_010700 [Hypsizygus marmoreus]